MYKVKNREAVNLAQRFSMEMTVQFAIPKTSNIIHYIQKILQL